MYKQPPNCLVCKISGNDWYIKKGYFTTKYNGQPVPRYQCKACHTNFSASSHKETYRQKKPHLNKEIFQWYCSSTTQRRMALVLQVNRATIVRKFLFMAEKSRKLHEHKITMGDLKTSYVQFDEMQTFEHTRLKPLSITLAIRGKTGEIIDAQVASMSSHGPLASLSKRLYGWRLDNRDAAREDVLKSVMRCSKESMTILSDKATSYPLLVKKWVPHARLIQRKSIHRRDRSQIADRKNPNDKMFTLNYVSAKIRHDLSRMGRKTWVTTKKPGMLQAHLYLYIAWNNKYEI